MRSTNASPGTFSHRTREIARQEGRRAFESGQGKASCRWKRPTFRLAFEDGYQRAEKLAEAKGRLSHAQRRLREVQDAIGEARVNSEAYRKLRQAREEVRAQIAREEAEVMKYID